MSNRILNNECLSESFYFDYGYKSAWNYKTDISQMVGGGEQRRARWEKPLRKYTLPFNNKAIPKLQALLAFFHDHKGAYDSFYFYENDCRFAWTVPVGYKKITSGSVAYIITEWRPIAVALPVNLATVPNFTTDIIVKVNGTQRTADISVDADNYKITFSGTKPLSTDVITVEYSYLTRVRFSTDIAELTGVNYNLGSTTLELVECR